jgi:internalin A
VVDVGPLSGLTALSVLLLTGAGVVDVGPLSGLTTLTHLYLPGTGVSDLGPLSELTALAELYLSRCAGIVDVGPLSELSTLTKLYLSFCRNVSFAPIRSLLLTLRELKLYQTDFIDLPTAICGERDDENVLGAVRAYYDDLGGDPEGDAELKVFLLGNGRVGKTKLARRLQGEDYGADHEPSTHGVRLGRFPLEVPGLDHPVWLNLWDFGGQDIYLGSHALFLQGQAVFLLLWHPDHEQGREYKEAGFTIRDRALAYWLDYLRGLAGFERDGRRVVESPVILIQSQCESKATERKPPVGPSETDFPNLYQLAYSARIQRGEAALRETLAEAVGTLFARRKQPLIGRGRAKVRAKIREMQTEPEETRKRTITRAEFNRICRGTKGISSPGEFLKFLHRSGVVFYRKGAFGDRVVIDQSWALEAVYTVFLRRSDLQDAIGAGRGRFTRPQLERYVWEPDRREKKLPPYTIEEQRTFLGLMEQCHICFRVREVPGQYDEYEYIAPELLPIWDDYRAVRFRDFLKSPLLTVTLRYDFLHDGVFRGLLSRIGDRTKDFAEYWKFGCWFCDRETDSEVLIRAESSPDPASGAGAITLQARGTRPHELLKTLVEAAVKLPLGVQPRVDPPDFAARPDRPDALAANRVPAEPLADIDPSYPKRTLFISYRHAESGAYVRELAPVLEAVTGDPARVIWDNKLRDDESISGFIDSVRTIPVLVAVLGPSYLRSRYCLSELFAAWESSGCLKERFGVKVLPLILDDAGIDDVADRGTHARHWSDRAKQLATLAGEFNLGDTDYGAGKQMRHWGERLGDALAAVADPKLPRGWNAIRADGFATIRKVLEERFRRLGVW